MKNFEDGKKTCRDRGFSHASLECPTSGGFEVFCANGPGTARRLADEECDGNPYDRDLNSGRNGHCVGPYRWDTENVMGGGWHRGAFYSAEAANSDAKIESSEECKTVGESIGKTFSGESSISNRPGGCFWNSDDDSFVFNTHIGKESYVGRVVCKMAAAPVAEEELGEQLGVNVGPKTSILDAAEVSDIDPDVITLTQLDEAESVGKLDAWKRGVCFWGDDGAAGDASAEYSDVTTWTGGDSMSMMKCQTLCDQKEVCTGAVWEANECKLRKGLQEFTECTDATAYGYLKFKYAPASSAKPVVIGTTPENCRPSARLFHQP
jgi:hypothetical protein